MGGVEEVRYSTHQLPLPHAKNLYVTLHQLASRDAARSVVFVRGPAEGMKRGLPSSARGRVADERVACWPDKVPQISGWGISVVLVSQADRYLKWPHRTPHPDKRVTGWLLEFYILATSKVISGQTVCPLGDFIVLPHWEMRPSVRLPNIPHYVDHEPTSPSPTYYCRAPGSDKHNVDKLLV